MTQQRSACQNLGSCAYESVCASVSASVLRARACPCVCVCVSPRVRSVVELGHGRQLRRVCSETQRNESGTKRLDGGAGKRFPAVGGRDSLEIQL